MGVGFFFFGGVGWGVAFEEPHAELTDIPYSYRTQMIVALPQHFPALPSLGRVLPLTPTTSTGHFEANFSLKPCPWLELDDPFGPFPTLTD